MRECALTLPVLNRLAKFLVGFIQEERSCLMIFRHARGSLRFAAKSVIHAESELMLRFVLRSTEVLARIKKRLPALQAAFPELCVCSVNIQPQAAALLEGPEEILLTAQGCISESYQTCKVVFAPQTFMQVTPQVASALYAAVPAMLAEQRYRTALDLFCGVGGFSFSLRAHVVPESRSSPAQCCRDSVC